MKKIILCMFTGMLFLHACDRNMHSTEQKPKDTAKDFIKPVREDSADFLSAPKDIAVLFPGKEPLQVVLSMEAGQHVTVPLDVCGDSVFAKLMSEDSMANIRITQIALPDQTFDGPFGSEMSYRIKTPGRYALIIGQNLMAGDPWKGSFTLHIWVK